MSSSFVTFTKFMVVHKIWVNIMKRNEPRLQSNCCIAMIAANAQVLNYVAHTSPCGGRILACRQGTSVHRAQILAFNWRRRVLRLSPHFSIACPSRVTVPGTIHLSSLLARREQAVANDVSHLRTYRQPFFLVFHV